MTDGNNPINTCDWTKKRKGNPPSAAWIHKHPDIPNAVVQNAYGVMYKGEQYRSVAEAKKAAMAELRANRSADGDEASPRRHGLAP